MGADAPPDPATARAPAKARQASTSETNQSLWTRFRNQFHPRPIQDDKPRDWWFASTAIPLIAAATAPFANVMSIVALAIPWRETIHYDKIGTDGLPLQVPYSDPNWYGRKIERAIYMLRSELQGCGAQCDIPRVRCNREYLLIVQFHPSGAIYHRAAGLYRALVASNRDCESMSRTDCSSLTRLVDRNHFVRPRLRTPGPPS